MGWNPEKWVRFTSPYLNQPRVTEPPSDQYKEEVKEEAAQHEERVDLDALGRQRVKELLEIVASETPGSQGQPGANGVASADAITQLAINKEMFNVPTASEMLRHTIAAGELDGTKDLIKISCYMWNLSDVQIIWDTGATKTLFAYSLPILSAVNPADGYADIWIAQQINTFDVGGELRSIGRSIGITTHQYENTNVGVGWMAGGGDIVVDFYPQDIAAPYGGLCTISKFVFPSVTIE